MDTTKEWKIRISNDQVIIIANGNEDVIKHIEPSKTLPGIIEVYTNDKEKGCHYSLSELEFACDKSRLYFEGKRKSRTLFTDKWTEVVKTLSREQGSEENQCGTEATTKEQPEDMFKGVSYEAFKHHLIGSTMDVPVSCLVEPSGSRLLRLPDRQHIDHLKEEMLANKMKSTAMIGHIVGLKANEVDIEKIKNGEYKIETLAGNHRRMALQEMVEGDTSLFYRTWPVMVFSGLTEQQALNLSYRDNRMLSVVKPTTLQDEAVLFRERLKIYASLPTSGPVELKRKERENWFRDIRTITGYPSNVEINSRARAQITLAKSSETLWIKMMVVFQMWDQGSLLGKKNATSIPIRMFKSFPKMTEHQKLEALDKFIAKEVSITKFPKMCRKYVIKSSDTLEDDVEEVMVPEMSQDEDSTMEKEGSTKKNRCTNCRNELVAQDTKIRLLENEIQAWKRKYNDLEIIAAQNMKKLKLLETQSQVATDLEENCSEQGNRKETETQNPQAGEIVVLDWGHGKIFLGLVLKSGEVMSTKTSLLKSKKDIAEGVMPKGLLQLNARDVSAPDWKFLLTKINAEVFTVEELTIHVKDNAYFMDKIKSVVSDL